LNISAVHDIIAASSVNITHVNISAGLVRFDAEYSGIGKTENSTVTYRITGFRPFKKTGGLPVYIWMAGLSTPFGADKSRDLTLMMAKRGFIAAEVDYENNGNPPDVCFKGVFDHKFANFTSLPPYASVSPTAKANSTIAALDVLCSLPSANCSKGVATHGFGQATWVQGFMAQQDARITAMLLWGASDTNSDTKLPGLDDVPEGDCLDDPIMSKHVPRAKRRYIVGALDEFKAFSDHERGLRKMTGVSCNSPHDDAPDEDDSGRAGKVDCILADGSGYYLVDTDEYSSEYGDTSLCTPGKHNFWSIEEVVHTVCPSMLAPHLKWALPMSLDWLAKSSRTDGLGEVDSDKKTKCVKKTKGDSDDSDASSKKKFSSKRTSINIVEGSDSDKSSDRTEHSLEEDSDCEDSEEDEDEDEDDDDDEGDGEDDDDADQAFKWDGWLAAPVFFTLVLFAGGIYFAMKGNLFPAPPAETARLISFKRDREARAETIIKVESVPATKYQAILRDEPPPTVGP